jgi:hypothetical protein
LEALEGVLSKAEKLDQKVERTGRTGWLEIVWIHVYSVTDVCKFTHPLLAVVFPWCSEGSFQAWTGILSNLLKLVGRKTELRRGLGAGMKLGHKCSHLLICIACSGDSSSDSSSQSSSICVREISSTNESYTDGSCHGYRVVVRVVCDSSRYNFRESSNKCVPAVVPVRGMVAWIVPFI